MLNSYTKWTLATNSFTLTVVTVISPPERIIIGSDRRPETKQGIEGKIVRFRLGMVRDRVRVSVRDN